MINREWLSKLSNKELAHIIEKETSCYFCVFSDGKKCKKPKGTRCVDGIIEWLEAEYKNAMPDIRSGDYIFYKYGTNIYRAFCVTNNIIYLIDRGVCATFDGEIKQRVVTIQRYNTTKGMEVIWRAGNEKK